MSERKSRVEALREKAGAVKGKVGMAVEWARKKMSPIYRKIKEAGEHVKDEYEFQKGRGGMKPMVERGEDYKKWEEEKRRQIDEESRKGTKKDEYGKKDKRGKLTRVKTGEGLKPWDTSTWK